MRASIVQLADYGGPYSGNFIASLRVLGKIAREAGLRQVLVFSEVAKDREWVSGLMAEGFSVYFISPRRGQMVHRIAEILRRENACLVHTHFTAFDVAAWFAARRCRIPVVWHVHSAFPIKHTMARFLKDIVKFRVFGATSNVITVSEAIAGDIIKRGFPCSTVSVVHNGIDIHRATCAETDRAEMRERLGIRPGVLAVLAFGWDPLTKGIDIILEAVEARYHSDQHTMLVVVGEERLKSFVDNRYPESLPPWLRVISPTECVADLYQVADLFVSASRWEGFSYSVGEALANGLPVIASDIPGLRWAKGASGIQFFDLGRASSLEQAIAQVVAWTAEEHSYHAQRNKEFANERLSLTAWGDHVFSVYRELLPIA